LPTQHLAICVQASVHPDPRAARNSAPRCRSKRLFDGIMIPASTYRVHSTLELQRNGNQLSNWPDNLTPSFFQSEHGITRGGIAHKLATFDLGCAPCSMTMPAMRRSSCPGSLRATQAVRDRSAGARLHLLIRCGCLFQNQYCQAGRVTIARVSSGELSMRSHVPRSVRHHPPSTRWRA